MTESTWKIQWLPWVSWACFRAAGLLSVISTSVISISVISISVISAPLPAVAQPPTGSSDLSGQSLAQPFTYKLGPADVIAIGVFENPELSGNYTIDPEGNIDYPLLGQVHLKGLSALESKQLIRNLLEKDYLYDPVVSLTIVDYKSKKVTLFSDVGKPGNYYLDQPLRLLDLLVRANAAVSKSLVQADSSRRIRIVRKLRPEAETDPPPAAATAESLQTIHVDLRELLEGDTGANVALYDGDLIYLPTQTAMVHVTGEVLKPGSFPYEEGMTLLKLITLAGGETPKAAAKQTVALRPQDGKIVEVRLSMADLVQPEDMIKVKKSFW